MTRLSIERDESALPPAAAGSARAIPQLGATQRTALRQLRESLERDDFLTIHRLHCYELSPRVLASSLRQTLQYALPRAQLLFRLFYFEEAVRRAEVDEILGASLVSELSNLGLLVERGAGEIACPYPLRCIGDDLLFTEDLERRSEAVYFGEDSQFLRALAKPRPGDLCLDFCTGTGIQGLRCAQVASRVDLVDVHAPAVRLARINAALSGVGDRVEIFEGDLWHALPAGRRYDYVLCNPPLLPVSDDVSYPLFGHGGPDGLRVVRELLEPIPDRLTETGRCSIIGACTGDADRSKIETLARELLATGFTTKIFLLSQSPIADWIRMVARTAAMYEGGTSFDNAVLRSKLTYRERNDETTVFTYLLETDRSDGASCEIIDYSRVGQRSFWFVNRGTIAE